MQRQTCAGRDARPIHSKGLTFMNDRRLFLGAAGSLGLAAFAGGIVRADEKQKKEEEVSPAEDLMREHGVLNRVLLLYEEGLRRLRGKEGVDPDVFHRPAALVRKFVEDYHEQLEEKFLFPRFEERKKLAAIIVFFIASALFWSAFEQAGGDPVGELAEQ